MRILIDYFNRKSKIPDVEIQPYGLIALDILEYYHQSKILIGKDLIAEMKRMSLEKHPHLTFCKMELLELYEIADRKS